jgi:hypothetical protein
MYFKARGHKKQGKDSPNKGDLVVVHYYSRKPNHPTILEILQTTFVVPTNDDLKQALTHCTFAVVLQ